ncbi:limonene-1,2-epoxide hydrolase family protein [Pseudomonas sp. SA3-5]|uniref:Limonene-1,2-epoxide hydrolase family protein n=1 Tax=Pseudomonas aestuarii TaxID=3018340 RepID=A0ABT4XDJ7_9PSED|nr:limonene-1,2-epoxide hydrolase family protein [Pseudomonas aestuarii]MDA7086262.1 limonene-1,2-epoxide hydrolase family protein [Pseudomonas aestuarii]
MVNSEQVVREFIGHFHNSWPDDLRQPLALLAEDAYYQMVTPTIAAVHGREDILKVLEAVKAKVVNQKHELIKVATLGNVVFMERVDQSYCDGKWVDVPMVAVFELNDAGKIIAWREYLDR